MIQLHFCRSSGLGAWVIRTFTMSHWNHVAIEVDGTIWQSTSRRGVHITTLQELRSQYHTIESIPVDAPEPLKAVEFLKAQQGKSYDWGAVFGMFFRAGWHDAGKWFCSELTAAALEVAGKIMRLPHHRVTPKDQWVAA